MKSKLIITLILSVAVLAGCQKVQEAANDAEDLASADSPLTNPTSKELEAVKTPCDDAGNQQDAENCAKSEFEKADAEMNQLYQKILTSLQNIEQKTRPLDKAAADKDKKDVANLQTAQKVWLAYRDADCLAEQEAAATESDHTIIAFSCRQRLTEDRTEDLKTIYQNK